MGGWFKGTLCLPSPCVAFGASVVGWRGGAWVYTAAEGDTEGEGEGRLEVGDKQASPCTRHPQGWGVVGWVGGWRVVVGSAWGSRKRKRQNEEGHAFVSQTKSLLVSDCVVVHWQAILCLVLRRCMWSRVFMWLPMCEW